MQGANQEVQGLSSACFELGLKVFAEAMGVTPDEDFTPQEDVRESVVRPLLQALATKYAAIKQESGEKGLSDNVVMRWAAFAVCSQYDRSVPGVGVNVLRDAVAADYNAILERGASRTT